LVRAIRGIDEAARRGDIACAAALPKDLREWAGATDFLLGPYASGKDLSALSAVDQSMAQRREALSSCRQGVGSLVAKLGEVLPVALSTPVTRIVWSGRDVQVETPSGTIAARGAIVTASTNVLAAGRIKFSPELPKRQSDAFARLSLGSYDHIALELPGNPLGLARDDVVIEQSADNRTAFLLANLGGSSLCQVDVAGAFGADISARGEAAMTAFAVEWLTKLFGGDVAAAVKWKTATRWNDMPYVLGAMSAAAPGGQSSRKALMETVGSIFFAGEATHETQWGTVGGAWESGERAADAALRKISGGKDAPVVERPTVKTKKSAKRSTTTSAVPPAERGLFWPRN
jgi:monoamine oxidase